MPRRQSWTRKRRATPRYSKAQRQATEQAAQRRAKQRAVVERNLKALGVRTSSSAEGREAGDWYNVASSTLRVYGDAFDLFCDGKAGEIVTAGGTMESAKQALLRRLQPARATIRARVFLTEKPCRCGAERDVWTGKQLICGSWTRRQLCAACAREQRAHATGGGGCGGGGRSGN